MSTKTNLFSVVGLNRASKIGIDMKKYHSALRNAFIARFIVLTNRRRSRANGLLKKLTWTEEVTAEQLAEIIKGIFVSANDFNETIEKDIAKSIEHANYSAIFFTEYYHQRSILSIKEAVEDYKRSNELLFGDRETTSSSKLPTVEE